VRYLLNTTTAGPVIPVPVVVIMVVMPVTVRAARIDPIPPVGEVKVRAPLLM
jgi:hypothetical protein